jgi:hypothetical protein
VNLALDGVRLYSNKPALAFSSQLNKSTLTHTVDVLTNSEKNIEWQASSDAEWLTIIPESNNNTLLITADPTKVIEDGFYTANISLSSVSDNKDITGLINVSLSKGNFDTNSISEIVLENISPNSSGIVLDPFRPNIYIAQEDKIEIYNIIDGTKVNTIQSPLPGITLTNLVIHPDGSLLLGNNTETYLDENEQEQTRTNYYQITLTDFSIYQIEEELIDVQYRPQKIIMVSGKPIVVTQALEFANLSLTTQYWDNTKAFLTSTITDIESNNSIIAYNGTTLNLYHNTLQYNEFSENSVVVINSFDYINPVFENGLSAVEANKNGSII